MQAQVNGEVRVRPARVGMVFQPSSEKIHRASQLASSAWGGIYFPWIDPVDQKQADRTCEVLSLDALVPLDDGPESQKVARRPGFFWRGLPSDAFGEPEELFPKRLQGPAWLLDDCAPRLVLPSWNANDPLACLFSVWFGGYGNSDYEHELSERFANAARREEIIATEELPDVSGWVAPIGLTGLRVENSVWPRSLGFVLVDADDPMSLALFWNVRAQGDIAFPWPLDNDERCLSSARAWFEQALVAGHGRRLRSGSGEDLGPDVVFWSREASAEIPECLQQFGQPRSQRLESLEGMLPMGWTGNHPLNAECSRTFSRALSEDANEFSVPLPRIDAALDHGRGGDVGVVAAQVVVYSESRLPTGWTVAVPRIRELASVTDAWPRAGGVFHRPTGDGRAFGIRADDDEIDLAPVPSLRIFAQLTAEAGWKVGQSDNGRFASRLIDLLGGPQSQVGNQPALRAVLDQAARSTGGCTFDRLVQTAHREQGEWPEGFAVPGEVRSAYPRNVVFFLLQKHMLRPYLPVKCPSCAITTTLPPEGLAAELRCDMCSKPVPLGLALALAGKRSGWKYGLSASIREDRLRETLPLMAALSVFSSWTGFSSPSMPCVLGLRLETERGPCEIDLALMLEDRGRPTVVIGEVKSWRGDIDEQDLVNLVRVQGHFRKKGIECFLLAATLKEELTASERKCLRAICEAAPETLGRQSIHAALPIVLTRDELSVPPMHEQHPSQWGRPRSELPEIAIESCRRNLGLVDVAWTRGPKGGAFALQWGDTESDL